ncbi:ISNCY family transposase, partial [Serratia nevei]|nr:ISNCY family transposase [Serratia nevei]
ELLFVKSESTFSYFEATRRYIDKHGKPLALYSDKAGVFRVNNKHATGGDGHTQFGRAMHELNIQTICAET